MKIITFLLLQLLFYSVSFAGEAKERAMVFISKANPYLHITSISEQSREREKNRSIFTIILKLQPDFHVEQI